ncbi:PKD domain-containing protein [Kitasatospora sp. NPDC002227]|uniref:PKD domain-containing protein n=1 Tax=Kitasatospora sp. NPDC002227 TaxID=3154773 RepID=UPI003328ABFE
MRLRILAGLVTVTGVVLGTAVPGLAVADAATLYVDSTNPRCTDSGAGAGGPSAPFCTIQAAADAVQAGQTVEVVHGSYPEKVTVTHSGEPGKPVTFRTGVLPTVSQPVVGQKDGVHADHGFVLASVHDIVISGFTVTPTAEPFVLTGTSRVTLESNRVRATGGATPAVRIGGGADATTLSRNFLFDGPNAVVVEGGATGTTVTGNVVDSRNGGGGVRITDSTGTVVTGNTVSTLCAPGIALLGDSSKSVIENNVVAPGTVILGKQYTDCAQQVSPVKVVVSAFSAVGTKLDYNLVQPVPGRDAYEWSDAPIADHGALFTRLGQGEHDINTDPKFGAIYGVSPGDGSPAVDSADANAPGALSVDLVGHHRIDDPNAVNSGSGVPYYDRGAIERTDQVGVWLMASTSQIPTGHSVGFTASVTPSWSAPVSYRYDFGDGTPPLETDRPTADHVYTTAGYMLPSLTVTFANGNTLSVTSYSLQITEPGPIVPRFMVVPRDDALAYGVEDLGSTSAWPITGRMYDFGDGTGQQGDLGHQYTKEGDYTVTMYVTDQGGQTAKLSQQLHVAYRPSTFHALAPQRALDTRRGTAGRTTLGPGQSLTVPRPAGLQSEATALVLNVTAVNHTGGGYLAVYPAGQDRPTTSNVNFAAGQVVPNLVTVPVGRDGEVSVYNRFGSTDVVVDVAGYYSVRTESGDRFTAQAPVRLLDTRTPGHSAVASGVPASVRVRGLNGVPADATAAVLNVTATRGTGPSYFSLYPEAGKPTGTSNLNFGAGQTVANQVVVPIGADGSVQLSNFAGRADAIVDLFGYYSPKGAALFQPVTPRRLADTRTPGKGALGPGGQLSVATGAPAGATGAVVNLTATAPTVGGYLTAWADGSVRPGTSNLNFLAGQTVPNHVTTPLSSDGRFDVYNFAGNTQVVADLFGYYVKG